MLEIAVCDDDEKDLLAISGMVKEICQELKRDCHISVYQSPEVLLGGCHKIDIGVLDIVMPEYNGIDLGRRLKEKFPEIGLLYITGHEEYCRQVINQVHAYSFLVKPIDRQELKEQLAGCMRIFAGQGNGQELIFRNVRNSRDENVTSIRLQTGDILYCEYVKSKREICIVLENETYYYKAVFERLARELVQYGFAVNCRGSLVNLCRIRRLKGYSIYLDNGKELWLTQKRVAEFKEQMNAYIRRG